jgi:predicted RecA/RadA family phage recombinase
MRNMLRPEARSIPMAVPYAGGILSGQGMLVGAFFGVAAMDAEQNATVECETRGEFELAKDPTQAMTVGARVFWDNTNRRLTTTATSNFQVGIVTAAALFRPTPLPA